MLERDAAGRGTLRAKMEPAGADAAGLLILNGSVRELGEGER